MTFLTALWLPILLCGVALFFASFVAWNILPHHFRDRKKLECEDDLMNFIREQNIAPGNYMFPYAHSRSEQSTKEFMEKFMAGPVGILDVYPAPNMGRNLGLTLLFFLVTGAVIGYITYQACPPGDPRTNFMQVFRIAGTIGMLVHASTGMLNAIWFRRRVWTDFLDGIVYGLIIGLIFAALWPAA